MEVSLIVYSTLLGGFPNYVLTPTIIGENTILAIDYFSKGELCVVHYLCIESMDGICFISMRIFFKCLITFPVNSRFILNLVIVFYGCTIGKHK